MGHSHSCASSVPAYPAVARGPAYGVSERLGDITAPLVFLGVDVLHWSEARRGLACAVTMRGRSGNAAGSASIR